MPPHTATRRPPSLTWAVAWSACIVAVGVAAWGVRFYFAAQRPSVAVVEQETEPVEPSVPVLSPIELAAWRTRAWDKITPRLDEADALSEAAVDAKLAELADFLRDRRTGVPAFAAEVMSLSGKWKFVKSKLPSAEDDVHLRYLHEQFERSVFSTAALKQTVESTVGGYLSRVQGLEAQLLVDVRADLADASTAAPGTPRLATDDAQLQADFERLLQRVAGDVSQDVGVGVSLTTASLVGGEVAAHVAVRVATAVAARLGTSAGILGVGAASSWGTFGLGLVAAVAVDVALNKAVKAAGYDPVEAVAARVNAVLDQVQTMLIDGEPEAAATYAKLLNMAETDDDPEVRAACRRAALAIERSGKLGLRRELMEMHKARAAVRRAALRQFIWEDEA